MAIFVDSKLQVHKRKGMRKDGGCLQLRVSEADPRKVEMPFLTTPAPGEAESHLNGGSVWLQFQS